MSLPLESFDPPPLRWTGSKWQLAEWIIGQFPPHDCYVEPYCGGAAVFFRKHASKIEVLNDLDGSIVNFFNVLRTRPDALIRAIDLTPYSRAEYELAYEPSDDPLESARRFYVLTRQSWGAFSGQKAGWRNQKNRHRGTSITSEWRRLHGLRKAIGRLKNAQIEHDDALKVIKRYDTPQTLFYLDPPYVLSSRSQGVGRRRYTHEMTDAEHRQLAAALYEVQGMAIISGYKSELYDELYLARGWKELSKSTTTNGNSVATEYLWLSPKTVSFGVLPLFEETN